MKRRKMSNIAIKDIMIQFNVKRDKVKQFNSCQLFIVDSSRYGRILVSYQTIIGMFYNGIWYITAEKYSVTTSKQANTFIKSTPFKVERVEENTLRDMVNCIKDGLPPVVLVKV